MLEFISQYWFVWVVLFVGSAIFVGYSHYKARQRKDFIATGSVIGCIVAGFSCIGAVSAILSIIAAVLKLIVWGVVG